MPDAKPFSPAHYLRGIEAAAQALQPYLNPTPLVLSPSLSRSWNAEVWLKLENRQPTGSFKVRGALNSLLNGPAGEQVITASSGNHGAALAWAAGQLGRSCQVWVPESVSPGKAAAIRNLGAELRIFGQDGLDTEMAARREAQTRKIPYISPYNNFEVICGQATMAMELIRQLPAPDLVFIAVGGGGLIGGSATYLRSLANPPAIVGCSPQNSAVMDASVAAGKILNMASLPTLSDGTAGGVEEDSLTFDLCRTGVDEWLQVEETQIAAWIVEMIDRERLLVEGAAAVALAAADRVKDRLEGKKVVVVICGGNLDSKTLSRIFCQK
ncbi:MAG: pyridoxal-phosphate dependent enzyme [Calditrichaeota bacterium]|nr:pyridoxal-phosphate dependent enzyme [Calditrichota bacterium]